MLTTQCSYLELLCPRPFYPCLLLVPKFPPCLFCLSNPIPTLRSISHFPPHHIPPHHQAVVGTGLV